MKQTATTDFESPLMLYYNAFPFREQNQTALEKINSMLAYIDVSKIKHYPIYISNNQSDLELNRKFIELHISFDKQYSKLFNYYNFINKEELKQLFRNIAVAILDLNPDALSIQLTYDESLLFVIKEHGYTIYYEIFINMNSESEEKVVISVFSDFSRESGSYTFEKSMEYLSNLLEPNRIEIFDEPIYVIP